MLNSIATILATRSVEGVWQFYVSKMTDWGFPHIAYHAVRLLRAANEQAADDSLFLSSYSPRLLHDLVSQNLFTSVPMYRWMTHNRGGESWDWLQTRRLAGRLTGDELRALDIFTRYGHVSGYAISLADSVDRVRAGVIMSGRLRFDGGGGASAAGVSIAGNCAPPAMPGPACIGLATPKAGRPAVPGRRPNALIASSCFESTDWEIGHF